MVKKTPVIFLSHASSDRSLVEAFESLLTKSTNLTSADIFCSSLEGQGVPKGANFVDGIRDQVAGAKAVVALISPAYLDSAFCMAELGAAWALQTRRFPIIVPPNTFAAMNATLLGITGVALDDEHALAQVLEEICQALGKEAPASGVRSRALRTFYREWASLAPNIAGPSRIEASIHNQVVAERDHALQARDEAEEELEKAESRIAKLRAAKDRDEVAKIDAKYTETSWEEAFEEILEETRELRWDLGGPEIVRLLILDHLGKEIKPDRSKHGDEIARAVELDVYDDEDKQWKYGHEDVKRLFSAVNRMSELFQEHPEAVAALKQKGQRSDPDKIRFWEEHI